jgi:hypothetical protein
MRGGANCVPRDGSATAAGEDPDSNRLLAECYQEIRSGLWYRPAAGDAATPAGCPKVAGGGVKRNSRTAAIQIDVALTGLRVFLLGLVPGVPLRFTRGYQRSPFQGCKTDTPAGGRCHEESLGAVRGYPPAW